jgi:hypothetical protein
MKKWGIWTCTYPAIDDSFKRRRHGSVATNASAFLLLEIETQKRSRAVTEISHWLKFSIKKNLFYFFEGIYIYIYAGLCLSLSHSRRKRRCERKLWAYWSGIGLLGKVDVVAWREIWIWVRENERKRWWRWSSGGERAWSRRELLMKSYVRTVCNGRLRMSVLCSADFVGRWWWSGGRGGGMGLGLV